MFGVVKAYQRVLTLLLRLTAGESPVLRSLCDQTLTDGLTRVIQDDRRQKYPTSFLVLAKYSNAAFPSVLSLCRHDVG